jgi:hypothetical protein
MGRNRFHLVYAEKSKDTLPSYETIENAEVWQFAQIFP